MTQTAKSVIVAIDRLQTYILTNKDEEKWRRKCPECTYV